MSCFVEQELYISWMLEHQINISWFFWSENIDFLNRLYDTGKVYIILTTARPSSARDVTIEQLEREGVKYDNIIFDLFHANRTLINDYGTSNPYPTCDAVNIVRNSNELERFLKDLGK